jgi:phospholipid transport system transporter-binding protein
MSPPTVRLPASLSVRECAALKQQLLLLMDSADEVRVDLADVELIDTAALQLLFAFSRERIAKGLSTSWIGDSPIFRSAATTVGLTVGDFTGPSTNSVPA